MIKLSVIVPAYNEAATIASVVKKLVSHKNVYQVVVVNDGSKDKTLMALSKLKHSKLSVVSHTKNQGKGKAIQTGLKNVNGDYVLIQDADLEYDPSDIGIMWDPIIKKRTTVVYGSRFLGAHTNMFYWHYLGNKFLNLVINVLYNNILSDMETCYKIVPTKILKNLHLSENDFRIEPEITCKLLKQNIQIMEVPITYVGRGYEQGKKITWVDGFKALGTIFRIRFL